VFYIVFCCMGFEPAIECEWMNEWMSSAGTSSGPVALHLLLSDGWHEQPLNEVVEALAPNILVQFLSFFIMVHVIIIPFPPVCVSSRAPEYARYHIILNDILYMKVNILRRKTLAYSHRMLRLLIWLFLFHTCPTYVHECMTDKWLG